jgi:hypothetical protein
MAKAQKNHLSHVIINIILTAFLILSCILIFAQTIINIKYNYSKNKTILAEKLVYEQFSHDIYSNINSKILYDFEVYPFSDECPENKETIIFPIKLDSYYDCEGVKIDTIDENICQNKITNSTMCCQIDCCENGNCRNKIAKNMEYEEGNDTRKDNCVYFNKYNGKFSQITKGYKICAKSYSYDYEYLLYLSEQNNIKEDACYYLDNYNHCINSAEIKGNLKLEIIENETFTLNNKNKNVIVKNIFSEITPNYFEYEKLLKESIIYNKAEISNSDIEEVERYKELNIKNIYETFFESIDETLKGGNYYYNMQTTFNISDIINGNGEPVFANHLSNNYIKQLQINWYTRNYIGFKNLEELSKFKENFDENDVTNNPLYQISNDTLYPNIESIFVILVFLVEFITSFILQIKSFYSRKTVKIKAYLISDSLTQIFSPALLIIYFFIYLFKYVYKYKKIDIEMEIYYQVILDQYNKRRNQDCLLAGIIFLFITLVLILINYIIMVKIYDINGINSSSGLSIICTLKNMSNEEEYQFKFYLNRKFSSEMERFKEKYFQKYDIDECKFKKNENEKDGNEIIIDENKKVGEIGLQNKSIIYVECELK